MRIFSSDKFEKRWKDLLNKQKGFEKHLKKRRRFIITALESLEYREALNTNYFEKCKGSQIIHSVSVWRKGTLNVRFLCAMYNEGEMCVYLDVFLEKSKEDYKIDSKIEEEARQTGLKERLRLWYGE